MKDVYGTCPVLENTKYLLRFMEINDAKDLLKLYSDKNAVPYFNSDNCNGDKFFYETLEQMENAIKYWIFEYERKGFVRWSIIDKKSSEVIGTVELFHRVSKDYFNSCGILRLDLRSDYEKKNCISEILSIIVHSAYKLFQCNIIATKAEQFATERIEALQLMNFKLSQEKLMGHDGLEYGNYWTRLE
ncbi:MULTISPECIES: GNAT family N-acetyltransferase [Clostridium]|uniref:GNAT family N-acetyltransferase n=1 Tax=Clostridium TaxID=1485 RepID=UPI00082400BD|nr:MULTISPECIES: GNAT family N-acetyltransferase [Clostridium]PJI07974.1 N-acetyltransferase [Clostridium sp. CT7]